MAHSCRARALKVIERVRRRPLAEVENIDTWDGLADAVVAAAQAVEEKQQFRADPGVRQVDAPTKAAG